ncbi:MAG: integral rane sensor signal transduction histidine kinase [Bryobacterales bacterium]|nr:integral rane sensor signal transduction histidine kinase [Bryobacterales bacterium]
MNRLRNKLVLVFLAATLAPLLATFWITTRLLETSLSYASIRELDDVSKSLENTGREFYLKARESLKAAAQSGEIQPTRPDRAVWPEAWREFWEIGEPERFLLAGEKKDRIEYLVREPDGVAAYSRPLGIGMGELTDRYTRARQIIADNKAHDYRRGFNYTYVSVTIAMWLASLAGLIYLANRISRPIRQLTTGLSELAEGNFSARLSVDRDDEVGRATRAFNHTASQLQQSRERLVYLTQLASWQVLARKMAHEVKNSLTPIRLTVEEMVARHSESNRAFLEQADAIVVEEVESLERRVRAFSEFSAEPDVCPEPIDVNSVVEERIAFLKSAHPEVSYAVRFAENTPSAMADEDLVKGILVNLLENAAEAAGSGGRILAATSVTAERVVIEVHDSGPGLSDQARNSLFQPTISFKKRGMGLGLSIARKSALILGGDILLVAGELGGAGFRVTLPVAHPGAFHS